VWILPSSGTLVGSEPSVARLAMRRLFHELVSRFPSRRRPARKHPDFCCYAVDLVAAPIVDASRQLTYRVVG
jgi:hypothetical protein